MVSDQRSETQDTFIFKNKTNTTTPFLMASYVNEVATGELKIVNSVNTELSKDNTFKYAVVYSNVFGGDSQAANYTGEYTVVTEDGKKETKVAKDGIIELKANENATIKGIPVSTKVAVQQQEMKKAYYIESIDATKNFQVNKDQVVVAGNIAKKDNEIVILIDSKEQPKATSTPAPKKKSKISNDNTPKTSDDTNLSVIFIGALALLSMTVIMIIKRSRKMNKVIK